MFFIALSFFIHNVALSLTTVEYIDTTVHAKSKSMISVQFVAPTRPEPPLSTLSDLMPENKITNKKSITKEVVKKPLITAKTPTKTELKSEIIAPKVLPKGKLTERQKVAKKLPFVEKQALESASTKSDSKTETIAKKSNQNIKKQPVFAPEKEKNIVANEALAINKTPLKKRNITQPLLPKMVNKVSFSARPTPIEYPHSAKKRNLEGRVLVEVWLDAQGAQTKQLIVRSSGHHILDNAALQTIRQWQFSRHQAAGQSIAHRVHVPINFELN